MVDFAQADFGTNPNPLVATIVPVVSGTSVQMTLPTLPNFSITYTPSGSGWQKFNADTLGHVANTIIAAITPVITQIIQSKAQAYLNSNASFSVPPVPISFDGVSLKLTPSNLVLTTSGTNYVLITGNVTVS